MMAPKARKTILITMALNALFGSLWFIALVVGFGAPLVVFIAGTVHFSMLVVEGILVSAR